MTFSHQRAAANSFPSANAPPANWMPRGSPSSFKPEGMLRAGNPERLQGIEEEKPEEKIKTLTAANQGLDFRRAVLEAAVEHGIGKESIDFFEFLISKAASELDEGEELPDEKMLEIVAKCKKGSGESGKGKGDTSVGNGGKGEPNPDKNKAGDVTLSKFLKMTVVQKSELYTKNRELYESLVAQAKAEGKSLV